VMIHRRWDLMPMLLRNTNWPSRLSQKTDHWTTIA
jgi:hypothetical protein